MSRFIYNASTPIGQIIAEGISSVQESHFKLQRASEAVTQMSEQEAQSELGVDDLPGFRSALNQLNAAFNKPPFSNLLPLLDQG